MGTIKDKLIFRLIISVIIVISFSIMAVVGGIVLKALEWGPTPIYVLSPQYAIVRSTLCVIDPNNFNPEIVAITRTLSSVIQENVNAFYVKDNWILGKTDIGYFVININTGKVEYPVESFDRVNKLYGVTVSPSDWIDTHEKRMISKYLYRRPQVQTIGKIWNYSFMVLLPISCIFFISWIIRSKKQTLRENPTKG